MTAELTDTTLCAVISEALKVANNTDSLSAPVTMAARMGDPREWDSLSFVAVYNGVTEVYDVELDEDDAIHFLAAQSIFDLLEELLKE